MTGWDEHGHAVPTGLPIDRYLRSGELQDAENCGYEPISVLAEIGIDRTYGRPQTQYRNGRIVCSDGTVLERGGTLNCVWAVTRLPPPDPGVAGSLDKQAIRDATPTSRCGLCGHHAVDHGRSLGGGNMSCAVCPDRVCCHHSGVAGEPEATTKEASEIDSPVRPTQLPVPTPDGPAAADVAGVATVSKLVRDRVPDLIRESGEEPVIHVASDAEFRRLLREKLIEEVAEFLVSGDPTELADVVEVAEALGWVLGVDLDRVGAAKIRDRGGFVRRYVWSGNRPAGVPRG